MAAQKSLNPEAPEFIPSSSQLISTAVFSDHYVQTSSSFSPPSPHFFYLYTLSSPFFKPPFYSNPYPLHPSVCFSQLCFFSPAPVQGQGQWPPTEESVGMEISCEETQEEKQAVVEKKVVVEKVRPRVVRQSVRNRWVLRKVGGCGRSHESQNKQDWRVRVSCGQNQYHKKVESKPVTPEKSRNNVLPVRLDGNETTVMIRNVPNKYTREMLLQFLDEHCMKENQKLDMENSEEADGGEERVISSFDFLYLPIDFHTGLNKSYAFVNFTHSKAVRRFYLASHGQKWEHFQSKKIREIACAKIQGKEALVEHMEKAWFACDREEFLPLCFHPARDGSRELVKQSTVGRCMPAPLLGIGLLTQTKSKSAILT